MLRKRHEGSVGVHEELQMMIDDRFPVIVERRLKIRSSVDDQEKDLLVRIGKPYMTESNGDAVCPVAIDGLFGRLPDIRGVDEMDALRLALELVENTLRERAGEQVFWPDGEPYS